MKTWKGILCLLLGGTLVALTACGSDEEAKLVNTQTIAAGSISNITLDYDADDLLIKNSNSKKIILEEYLSRDKRKYFSKINKGKATLSIKEGKRPLGTGFKSKMVLFLPKGYADELQVHSTSGKIETELSNKSLSSISLDTTSGKIYGDDLTADTINLTTTSGLISSNSLIGKNKLQIKSTSGQIKLRKLEAKQIQLHTTSSKAALDETKGRMDYETKSGRLELADFSGEGDFTASGDGSLNIAVKHLSDDLSVFSKNGSLSVSLPESQSAQLAIKSKEGKIKNQREESTEEAKPSAPKVILETRNGDITVK